jgi:integrase
LLAAANLPRRRFHDLRHTAATLMLQQNVNPKIVSNILGHGDVAFTLTTYSHVVSWMQGPAADGMDDALS